MSLLLSLLCNPHFIILVFFEDPHFQWQPKSGTWGTPELKTWLYKTLLCPGDTWTVSPLASAPRASINPKPAPVAHLEFLTSPPKQPIGLEGAELDPTEEGEHRSWLSAGCLVPTGFHIIFTYLHLQGKLQKAKPPGPHGCAILWVGNEPCCDSSGSHGLPGAVCEGIPWDFSWCRVWDVPDVSDDKNVT